MGPLGASILRGQYLSPVTRPLPSPRPERPGFVLCLPLPPGPPCRAGLLRGPCSPGRRTGIGWNKRTRAPKATALGVDIPNILCCAHPCPGRHRRVGSRDPEPGSSGPRRLTWPLLAAPRATRGRVWGPGLPLAPCISPQVTGEPCCLLGPCPPRAPHLHLGFRPPRRAPCDWGRCPGGRLKAGAGT